MKKQFIIVLLLCNSVVSLGQNHVDQQALYWLRYQNTLDFSPKLYWTNEVDNRRFFDPDVEHQFIFHSRLHYKKNRWDVAGGLTLSWVFAQKPELGYDNSINEIRGTTEASYEIPIGKVAFQNRVRLDNRFFQEIAGQSVFDESIYVLRFRYRAQFRIPLKENELDQTVISLRLADEVMFNHTGNTFDQNRIYATLEFFLTKKLSVETGYIYIYQQRFRREEFFERHVARLSLLHRIDLY